MKLHKKQNRRIPPKWCFLEKCPDFYPPKKGILYQFVFDRFFQRFRLVGNM